jgi:DNA-directed RNA polymerase specialized sigma subunit
VRDWLERSEREVLALHFGADSPAADIARILECGEANVYQISSRALRRLHDRRSSSELSDNT